MQFSGVVDKLAAWTVRIAYLVPFVLGLSAFFTHQTVALPILDSVFGTALAIAVVVHELLLTRRFQAYTAQLAKKNLGPDERQVISDQRRVASITILSLLAFCGFALWANQTDIHEHIEVVPYWLTNVVESFVLPIFAWLSTWLIEVKPDPEALLQRGAYRVLMKATRTTVKQWFGRLKTASKEGRNLSGIQTRLLIAAGDDESASRIAIIEEGLRATQAGEVVKTGDLYGLGTRINSALAGNSFDRVKSQAKLTSPNQSNLTGESGQKEPSSGGQNRGGRKPRSVVKLTPQQKVHAYLDKNPDASISEIVKATKVSKPTVILHRNAWLALHTLEERTGTEG